MHSNEERWDKQPYANTRDEQSAEAFGRRYKHRHGTPDGHHHGHDIFAHTNICAARDRSTSRGIEDGEGNASQQTKLRIAKVNFFSDWLDKHREDLPINKVDDIDQQEKT